MMDRRNIAAGVLAFGFAVIASAQYTTVRDESTDLRRRSILQFRGAGVSCADDGGVTSCLVGGGTDGSSGSGEYSAFALTSLPADGGTDALTDCDTIYAVTSGSTDTVWTLPSAATCGTGHWIEVVDSAQVADSAWLAWAPASGEAMLPLAADQRSMLARQGDSVRFVSDGTNWVCVGGCEAHVIDPRSLASMMLWLDAYRGIGVVGAGDPIRVVSWVDQAGVDSVSEVSGSGPSLRFLENGTPALYFNGSTMYMQSAKKHQYSSSTVSAAAVFSNNNTANSSCAIFGTNHYSGYGGGHFFGLGNGTANLFYLRAAWTNAYARAYMIDSIFPQMAVAVTGLSNSIYINGSALYTTDTVSGTDVQDAQTDGYYYVGQSHSNNGASPNWWTGHIIAVMSWDSDIGTAGEIAISKFLRRRFLLR